MKQNAREQIKRYRDKIDKLDEKVIQALAQRKLFSQKIGKIKALANSKVVDSKREEKLMLRYERLCKKHQLPPALIKKIFKLVILNSRKLQKQ